MKSLPLAALAASILAASFLAEGCVSTETRQPKTPAEILSVAARANNTALVEKLIAEGAVPGEGLPNDILGDGFGWAEYNGNHRMLEMLAKKCEESYVYGRNCKNAPCYAARRGSIASLTAYLDKGIDVNDESLALLGCAASEGNTANAKFLIKRGADVEKTISIFESSNAQLAAQNSAPAQAAIAKQNAYIAYLERLQGGRKAAASTAAGGGITRAEMEQRKSVV